MADFMRLLLMLGILLSVGQTALAQSSRDVTFISDTIPLKGTLTLPEGEGPHPGVVLLHGSGPNDRNQRVVLKNTRSECLYPHLHEDTLQNFRSLAAFFQKQGLATLRYDKRTYSYRSSVNLMELTLSEFIKDARAAISYLQAQPSVASDRIVLVGHSQGGTLLPVLAQQAEGVKGLVAMATPARSIDTVLSRQVKRMMAKCRDSTKALVRSERILYAFEQLRNGKWKEGKPLMNAYPPFWKSWLALTDTTLQAYQQVTVPTLFLNGAKDYNVPVSHLTRFKQHLKGDQYSFEMLKGVNHFLTPMDTPILAPALKKRLSDWLRNNGF
jgi:dienelactone hydrolase